MLERFNSERLLILAELVRIVVLIAATSHLIACFWYGLGNMSYDDPDTGRWIVRPDFNESSLGYRYTTSLHWAASQFTGGMDEVVPTNVSERIFAICIFALGFIMAAVSVSSITSSMTRLHIIGSQNSQMVSHLRRYLMQNSISSRLSLRLQRNAKHAMTEQSRFMPEDQVELLKLVSEPLRVDLHFEMFSPIFGLHPFFWRYTHECPQVMRKVCHHVTSAVHLSRGDVLFHAGEAPADPRMYIIVIGLMQYMAISGKVTFLHEEEWVAEATLWTRWVHRGVLTAMAECRIFTIDAKKFQDIVGQFEHPQFDPKAYAVTFVECLNSTKPAMLSDLAAEEIDKVTASHPNKSSHTPKKFVEDFWRRRHSIEGL